MPLTFSGVARDQQAIASRAAVRAEARKTLDAAARVLATLAAVKINALVAEEPTVFDLQTLRETLDTPIPYVREQFRCDCAACESVRAVSFSCDQCGFTGTPHVFRCTCYVPRPRTGPCGDSHVCHRIAECPVCAGERGQWCNERDARHPWEIIKRMRELLATT